MTWFETEEIAKYVFGVENALDDWRYDRTEMRVELAELHRAETKLEAAIKRQGQDKTYRGLVDEVLVRISNCRREIHERLME